jgi:hypothetical protein
VREVLEQVRRLLPSEMSLSEKRLISLLRAARHIERYPATDTNRGRPSRFNRPLLLQVASQLRVILERETQGRLSLSSFVDHYLRILGFPSDVNDHLTSSKINLFEATQLSRLTPARLGISATQARRTRAELLAVHMQARLSGLRLRERVNQLISPKKVDYQPENAMNKAGEVELDDFDPHDPMHLFYDEIKRLGFALKEIHAEDLTDALLEEYLKASEPLWAVLAKIERRKHPAKREGVSV